MTRTLVAAFVLLLALPAATATAQTIYRSVDPQGKVTYTDKPPPPNAVNVEEVGVQPGPSEKVQREARERAQRDQEQANQMRDAREQRLQQQQAAQPVPPPPVKREDPASDEVQAYPDPNPLFPGQVPERPGRQPVRPPNRPAQLPVLSEPR